MEARRGGDVRVAKWSGVVGLALGAISLVLAIVARVLGGSLPWTAWALPALIVSGLLVTLFVPPERFPRATKAYYFFAIVSALCILTSVGRSLIYR